jgi:hypothetical protein
MSITSTVGTALKNSILAGLSVVIIHFVFKNIATSRSSEQQRLIIPQHYYPERDDTNYNSSYITNYNSAIGERSDEEEDVDMINYIYGDNKEQFMVSTTPSSHETTTTQIPSKTLSATTKADSKASSPLGHVNAFEGFFDDGILASVSSTPCKDNATASLDALFAPLN